MYNTVYCVRSHVQFSGKLCTIEAPFRAVIDPMELEELAQNLAKTRKQTTSQKRHLIRRRTFTIFHFT